MSDLFFFFNDTATTEIYTLSLHDALPICPEEERIELQRVGEKSGQGKREGDDGQRSEEHTSELQSQSNLVCRLLLEKKKETRIAVSRRTDSTRHICRQPMRTTFTVRTPGP